MLMFLDQSSSLSCLFFLLGKKNFELNFSVVNITCFIAMQACLTHCAVIDRFDTSSKMEATSHSLNLFRELLQVVSSVVTKSFRFVSRILSMRFLV